MHKHSLQSYSVKIWIRISNQTLKNIFLRNKVEFSMKVTDLKFIYYCFITKKNSNCDIMRRNFEFNLKFLCQLCIRNVESNYAIPNFKSILCTFQGILCISVYKLCCFTMVGFYLKFSENGFDFS